VALAEKRSEFMVRGSSTNGGGAEGHSDSEERKLAASLRRSFDRSVDQSLESLSEVLPKKPSHYPSQAGTLRSSKSEPGNPRDLRESWETSESRPQKSTKPPSMRASKDIAPLGTAGVSSPNPTGRVAEARRAKETGMISVNSSITSFHSDIGRDTERDSMMPGPEDDISAIDKRIQALSSYLDKARYISIAWSFCGFCTER